MYRPGFSPLHQSYSQQCGDSWSWLIAPLAIWICVSLSLLFGPFGDHNLILGPSSSRLFTTNSVFVEQIQVRDDYQQGVLLYAFSEKPELSLVTNWNFSTYLLVGAYRRQGFSLWLNKGSTISIKWEAHIRDFDDLVVVLIKGVQKYGTTLPHTSNSVDLLSLNSSYKGSGEDEYLIEEDESYYVGVLNMSPRNIIMTMDVNLSSTMYNTSNAKSNCSAIDGFCSLNLLFPKPHFVVLTTPNNGEINGWYVELSFVARLVTYVAILGVMMTIFALIMKCIMSCESEETVEEVRVSETDPLIPAPTKTISFTYGTGDEEDAELGMCNSSEDLYDGKICVICYDKSRNCFFIPCGHCATCHDCAQRIAEGENKVCPICRRFIHKVRKLV